MRLLVACDVDDGIARDVAAYGDARLLWLREPLSQQMSVRLCFPRLVLYLGVLSMERLLLCRWHMYGEIGTSMSTWLKYASTKLASISGVNSTILLRAARSDFADVVFAWSDHCRVTPGQIILMTFKAAATEEEPT